MNLPKLAILAPANSVHTHRWVNALSEYFQVSLFSLNIHKDVSGEINNAVSVYYLSASGKGAYFRVHKEFERIASYNEFDVYNAHYASGYGTILRLSKRKPAVLNFWGSDIFEFPNKSPMHKWLLKKNVLFPDVIVSTSHVMAQEITKVFPGLKRDLYVVPFGVDLDKFKFKQRKLGNYIHIGTCKILSPIYAIDDMIRAFQIVHKRLKEKGQMSSLEIYGDGPDRKKLEELVVEFKLENEVNFHGWTPHQAIPDVLEHLDIFLLTSITESFGVSAIEAMATGLPVIATSTPGFSEVITKGKNGELVPTRDPVEMANTICHLIDDSLAYQTYSITGRKHVEDNYNWKDNVKKMADILHNVMR